jgi:hypothetical protein
LEAIISAVIKDESSEAKNRARFAISSTVPKRPRRADSFPVLMNLTISSEFLVLYISGVNILPGQIALTLIP